jgi:hypothetical protein
VNLKKALTQRLSQPIVASCVPLGVQHATNGIQEATTNATTMQQPRSNQHKIEIPNTTVDARATQQICCTQENKDSLFVALKKRVATSATDLRPEFLAEQACTWRLYVAESQHALTHYVCTPATSRAEVFLRFAEQNLIKCEVDQSCRSCGWRTGQALAGSPVWCSNPKRRSELAPVYGINHPAREIPTDNGSACTEFTSRP